VCLLIDKFLRGTVLQYSAKVGNVAVLFDPTREFGCFIASCYLYVCGRFQDIWKAHLYCCRKLNCPVLPRRIFLNFKELFEGHPHYPVLRHVRSVKVSTTKIPVFDILTEGRFQELVVSYRHEIEPQLEEYYYNKPVERFCDKEPAT